MRRWLAGLVLRGAARLVPARLREEWLREWRGELEATRRSEETGIGPLELVAGAVPDAVALRRSRRPGSSGSAGAMDGRRGVWRRGGETMGKLARDLRLAARSLARKPGFTSVAVVTLALGLGATAAIFTVVEGVLLAPLDYPAADRLLAIHHVMSGEGVEGEWPLTRHGYLLFRDENRVFEAMGAYQGTAVSLVGEGGATEERGALVTPGLWEVMGARPAAGRLLGDADSRPGAPEVVVLGYDLWQRRYGGDPGVVGRTVKVQGSPVEVVGVAESGLKLPYSGAGASPGVWLPYTLDRASRPTDEFRIATVSRLRPGVGLSEARQELDRLDDRLVAEMPGIFGAMRETYALRTEARPLRDQIVGEVDRALWVLFAAVGLVLLIAGVNVANLFLVRTEGRRGEVSLRAALGAGRWDLSRHFLAESLLLAVAAGAVGLGLALAGVKLLLAQAPPGLPRLDEIALGWPTVAFAAGLVMAVGLLLGAYPVLRFGVRPTTSELGGRSASGGGSAGGRGTRNGLVVIQVATALVLLVVSGVTVVSFQRLRSVEAGFDPEGVLAVEVALPRDVYPSPQSRISFWRDLLERIEGLPGVSSVAFGPVPLEMGTGCSGISVEGRPAGREHLECIRTPTLASPGYWELMGMELVEGRTLEPADTDARTGAVVITRDLARRLWPGESALGKGIKPFQPGPPFYRVVGVVEPIRGAGLDEPPVETAFLPLLPLEGEPGWSVASADVLVKTRSGSESALAPSVRRLLSELEPEAVLGSVRTMEEVVARSMSTLTFTMLLLGIAAAVALLLGLVGLYGVVAYQVSTRRVEMGIRRALGAGAGDLRRDVLGGAMALVAVGLGVGVLGSQVVNRGLRSLLYEVAPNDPVVTAGAVVILALTALAAAWGPARAATRVDPAEALRQE